MGAGLLPARGACAKMMIGKEKCDSYARLPARGARTTRFSLEKCARGALGAPFACF